MSIETDVTNDFYAIGDDVKRGYGAQLMVGDGASPEVFEAIAGVVSITPGEMSTEDIDVTHLRSPDAHREHVAGIRDSGAFTVAFKWLPEHASQSNAGGGSHSFASGGLVALWRGRQNHNFKIVLDGVSPRTEWPFRGYVASFQPGEIGVPGVIDGTASFQPSEAYDADLP